MRILFKVRTLVLLLAYVFCITGSFYLSYNLRYDFLVPTERQAEVLMYLPVVLGVQLLFLCIFKQFSGFITYFRLPDLLRIFMAIAVSHGLFLLWWFLRDGVSAPPRGVLMANFILVFVSIGVFRISIRTLRERYSSLGNLPNNLERVLIVGATDAGASIAAELMAKRALRMRPVGFLDDDSSLWGMNVHGIEILGGPEDLSELKESFMIQRVIIALPSEEAKRIKEIIGIIHASKLKAEIVHTMGDFSFGKVGASNIRSVDINDILGRDPIELDSEQIREMLTGKTVVVTGAGGSIGSELCRQIAMKMPRRIILVDSSERNLFEIEQELIRNGMRSLVQPYMTDILDEGRMRQLFEKFKPDIVFHAAACKHLSLMEHQPHVAIRNNVIGTKQIVKLSCEYLVDRFILVSTDKAVNPSSVMGATKRLAERIVFEVWEKEHPQTQLMVVRFGNVLGSSGSVVPIFKEQIATGGPVTVTHPEASRYFMTIPEAVGLVLQCATQGASGDIFGLDMGQPIKINDIASRLIELSGLRPNVEIDIKYIGLRPGEKIQEDFHYDFEVLEGTSHPRIMKFSNGHRPVTSVLEAVENLAEEMEDRTVAEQKKLIAALLDGEYTPHLD